MHRQARRALRSDARRYLTSDPDGRASVAAAAQWLRSLPLLGALSDARCRELVVRLRSEDRVRFFADHATETVRLVEFDGRELSPLTILAGLARLNR